MKTNSSIAMKVSIYTVVINIGLATFKMFAGILANSTAVLSDAANSFSDVFSTIIVIIGINMANKKADKEHPYGHERFECVAAIILSVIIFITGIGVGFTGVNKIVYGVQDGFAIPSSIALFASLVSVIVKEGMFWYSKGVAQKINSGVLMADALHHRSDVLASIGSFIGVLGARFGLPILDPIACIVICFFIIKASYDIFKDAIDKMMDKSCSDEFVDEIRNVIIQQESVEKIDLLRTRLFGDMVYVDVEIGVDGNFSLYKAHEVAKVVHDAIETKFSNVKHCMVHVNPLDDK